MARSSCKTTSRPLRRARRSAVGAVLISVLLTAACAAGEGGGVAVDTAAAGDADHVVELRQFAFRPDELEVAVGETVEFVNRDQTRHTVTAEDPDVIDVELAQRGDTVHVMFTEAGELRYACRPHDFMTGTISVVDGDR